MKKMIILASINSLHGVVQFYAVQKQPYVTIPDPDSDMLKIAKKIILFIYFIYYLLILFDEFILFKINSLINMYIKNTNDK
jgi:hypothetical protein